MVRVLAVYPGASDSVPRSEHWLYRDEPVVIASRV